MIKFFRKIRQRLLNENNFSKYLLYALGEIILVVIGILIALQINAWYETTKKLRLKEVYRQNLITDLKNDTLQLNARIKRNEIELLKRLNPVMAVFKDPETEVKDINELGEKIGITGLRVVNNYNTNTFKALTTSGNIDLFDDRTVQKIMELNGLQNFEIKVSSGNKASFFDIYNRYRERYLHNPDNTNPQIIQDLWERVDAFEHAAIYINTTEVRIHAVVRYISLSKEVVAKTEDLIQLLESQ